jgi:hypothetical protein
MAGGMVIDTVSLVAVEYPPAKAARHVLDMLSARRSAPSEEQRQALAAAVNAVVQAAGADREPAELAEFVSMLSGQGEAGRAARALDVAAATRAPGDLAKLAIGLGEIDGLGEIGDLARGDLAGALLAAVIRRRLPDDVAAAARALDPRLTGRLLTGVAEAGCVPDALHVVLALRARGDDFLAGELAVAVAARLSPAGVAEFVRGLRGHEEHATAWDVITVALGRDVRQVADLIAIFAGDEPQFADAVLEAAVHAVEPAERIVLAALLRDVLPPAVAAAVWTVCSHGLDGATLVRAFDALRHRAEPPGLAEGLREAAAALPVALVAELARSAHRWVGANGVPDMFRALVRVRPVADIGELSDCLLDHSERDLAWLLLDLAAEAVPGRDGAGDAAELIIALARLDKTERRRARIGRRDSGRWRDRIPEVISGVAARRDPALIMGMIDRLVEDRSYGDYAKAVRVAVVRSLDAGQLARLPQAGARPHLPVVLQIFRQAVVNQDKVPPRAVPGLVAALRSAGATDGQVRDLLEHIGSHPYLDGRAIISALHAAGLDADAQVVRRARGRLPR